MNERRVHSVTVILVGAVIAALIGPVLGFWLGKRASTWCTQCGARALPRVEDYTAPGRRV